MKKLIIAIAAILLSSAAANAQLGIVAGFTSSKGSLKEVAADVKTAPAYHAGIIYKFSIGDVFAIQPGLIYNVKGLKAEEQGTEFINFKTGFLEIPVQLQAGINLLNVVRPYAFAEPFIGFAFSTNNQSSAAADITTKKFEYGVGLGAGVEFLKHFQVSVKYYWNLGSLYDFNWDNVKSISKSNCNGICASLAFLF